MPSLYQRHIDTPEKALEEVLCENHHIFTWVGGKDKQGVRYGSYKSIRPADLVGRQYNVYWGDYRPSIEWTDVFFDPRTNKYVPKD